MNIQEFKSSLPKQWLNINANSVVSDVSSSVKPLSNVGLVVIPSGATPVTLSVVQAISGYVIISSGRSANIDMPLSAAIDTYLGSEFSVDGSSFSVRIINRETTNQLNLVSSEISAQPIQKAGATFNVYTEVIFVRLSGVWTPLNS